MWDRPHGIMYADSEKPHTPPRPIARPRSIPDPLASTNSYYQTHTTSRPTLLYQTRPPTRPTLLLDPPSYQTHTTTRPICGVGATPTLAGRTVSIHHLIPPHPTTSHHIPLHPTTPCVGVRGFRVRIPTSSHHTLRWCARFTGSDPGSKVFPVSSHLRPRGFNRVGIPRVGIASVTWWRNVYVRSVSSRLHGIESGGIQFVGIVIHEIGSWGGLEWSCGVEVGRWEAGKAGRWEGGKVGRWEGGKVGRREGGKMGRREERAG